MEVLTKQLQKRVQLASKKFGLNEREVINRAVSSYLGNMEEFMSLQQELQLWDRLSAETMKKHGF